VNGTFEIREYVESGRSPFAEWFCDLEKVTADRVNMYIRRLEAGNFGAAKPLKNGVFEVRMDFGPGYRVYYGRDGQTIIILLGGGSCAVEAIQTNKAKMITTRPYSDTIIARIKREPKFARLLYASAINAILEGETAEGLSILRDLVNAEISFKELARQTGLGEKSLHRMLNHNGNPTARNLSVIIKSIAEDLGIKPRVEVAACR
jgi:putative addiction module killer protein